MWWDPRVHSFPRLLEKVTVPFGALVIPQFPTLATAEGFGCSVAGLTRFPPLQSRSTGRLPLLYSENSSLTVGAATACFAVAETRAPEIPSPGSLARVIDRRGPVRTFTNQVALFMSRN